jgi:hypothetical protein
VAGVAVFPVSDVDVVPRFTTDGATLNEVIWSGRDLDESLLFPLPVPAPG